MFGRDMEGDSEEEMRGVVDGDNNEGEDGEANDDDVQPLLFVDINLGGDEQERIVVYEGDTADELAKNFCEEHNLDDETQEKLQDLLK